MNKFIKQLVVVVFVVAISMVFVLEFRPGTEMQTGGDGPRCALEISDSCIPYQEYTAAFRLVAPTGLQEDSFKQLRVRSVVLEGLVERWLLLREAERLDISVSDDEVTRHIGKGLARVSLPVARERDYGGQLMYLSRRSNGSQFFVGAEGPSRQLTVFDPSTLKFDYERYKKTVPRLTKLTEADFRVYQKKEAIAARVRALVRTRVHVSEQEAYRRYALEGETAVADYVRLEGQYYQRYVLDTSPDALATWSEANAKEVEERWGAAKDRFLPECRKARHILIKVDPANTDKAAAEKEAREKADSVHKRADAGEDFSDLARELSDDRGSAERGGELGCFGKGQMTKPFEDKAYSMKEGELSDLVQSQFGFHIIKLDQIATGKDAEKLGRAIVAEGLYLQKELERVTAEGAKQVRAAVADGKSLAEAIDAHLLAVLPEAARAAYEAGKGAKDGQGEKKGDDAKDTEGDESAAKGSKNAWTDPQRPKVETTLPFGASGPPFGGARDPAKAAGEIFALKKPGEVTKDVIKLYQGYGVAVLKERNKASKEKWAEDRAGYMERIRADKQRDALIAYVNRLRAKHADKISYNVKIDEEPKP